ncbi:hypothetical protein B296_00025678 [Ensete ventricosum]|uniref:beta-galactosidase n=1 Tax=Ensete ventricosum TaxID=4639 RepID=A0A426YHT4_ENSVE|nr:hypothetical protein B296_00025678 [Ensete ventricosum]
MKDSGAYLEHRLAGVHTVVIQGLNAGTLDLSHSVWGHQRYFDAPSGHDPVALEMSSMGKGLVWVNGESIGRYWISYLNPLGKASQSGYHVPRSFLKPKDNLMVVFEEHGGKPEDIQIMMVKRDDICTVVSDLHPANVRSWSRKNSQIQSVDDDAKPEARLKCTGKKVIQSIDFASFGNPDGMCGNFTVGSCHTPQAKAVAEKVKKRLSADDDTCTDSAILS